MVLKLTKQKEYKISPRVDKEVFDLFNATLEKCKEKGFTFKNTEGKTELIDNQEKLLTLMITSFDNTKLASKTEVRKYLLQRDREEEYSRASKDIIELEKAIAKKSKELEDEIKAHDLLGDRRAKVKTQKELDNFIKTNEKELSLLVNEFKAKYHPEEETQKAVANG